jgi:hypothetical protein
VNWKGLASMFLLAGLLVAPRLQALDSPLFSEATPLRFVLEYEFSDLCREPDAALCTDAPGMLHLEAGDGSRRSLRVGIRTRGWWRLHKMRCVYPPLFIVFGGDGLDGTPFERQTLLPLTTHCFSHDYRFRLYLLKEYLAYRIYGLFSDHSVRVRLAEVTYRDTSKGKEDGPRPAFFSEHFRSVAARSGAELLAKRLIGPGELDAMEMTTLAVFQYMIGNTDWSALAGHNVVLLRSADGRTSPLPFDFDFSGLVNADYAAPPPKLPIRRVTQRLYRGFCYPGLDWEQVYQTFLEKEALVMAARRAGEPPLYPAVLRHCRVA